MAKRLSLWLLLALVAAGIGLVAAPQAVFLASLVGEATLPTGATDVLLHVAFELGLWGAGVVVFLAAARLKWVVSRPLAVALVMAPACAEIALMLGLGRLSGGITGTSGLLTRLVIGSAAVAFVLWRSRQRRRQ